MKQKHFNYAITSIFILFIIPLCVVVLIFLLIEINVMVIFFKIVIIL